MSKVCPHCREKLKKEFENLPILSMVPPEEKDALLELILTAVEAAHTGSAKHELV